MKLLVRRQAFLLAAITGFCGLGSESVYLKLLDFSIGSAPLVAYAVVATFIAGMGVGSLLSPKIRRLWIVEATLAVYNLGLLLLLPQVLQFNAGALRTLLPAMGPNLAPAFLGFAYLLLPTLLLGITFPALIERSKHTGHAYALQAGGAMLGILLVEAILYPQWGLAGALLAVVAMHGVAAVLLYGHAEFRIPPTRFGRVSLPLLGVGVGTGAFQGIWLLLAALLFHPFYFIQPIVVASMLAGIMLGSLLWSRFQPPFERVLYGVLAGVFVSTALVAIWVHLPPPASVMAVVLQLPILLLPAAIPIGAVYPAYMKVPEIRRNEAGAALLSLSLGNAAGVLCSGALLLPQLTPAHGIAAAGAFIALVMWRAGGARVGPGLLVVATASLAIAIDEPRLIMRARSDHLRVTSVEKIFRGPGELSAIYEADRLPLWGQHPVHERRLYLSGFAPFILGKGQSLFDEALAGGIAVASSRQLERALVLGAGSGRAAGFVAGIFEHTDVVDLGSTVPEILEELKEVNYDLLALPGVVYHPMDAILAPEFFEHGSYDLVFCTVNPVYVSRAAKLYTREYIESAKRLLKPGGILVSWSDVSLPPEANQILINTVGAPFAYQELISVRGDANFGYGYYLMIQSDQPISYRPRGALMTSARRSDPAARSLRSSVHGHLIEYRAHSTTRQHSFFDPAPALLYGGYPHFGNETRELSHKRAALWKKSLEESSGDSE